MKKNELLSVFHALQSGKKCTSLAVVVGVLAMLLLLLSELLPSGTTQKAAVSTAQTATPHDLVHEDDHATGIVVVRQQE